MKRALIAASIFAVLAVAGFAALALRGSDAGATENPDLVEDGDAASAAAATLVRVADATLGPVVVQIETTSAVEAERTAEVLSRTSGVLVEVLAAEGQAVAKNAVLARVDARERRLAFEQANLRLSRADAELTRQQLAFEAELVSRHEYEKARFDRDLAASELETARLALDNTEIRAPFAGRVTEVRRIAGENIEPAEHLLTLADFNTLITRLYLPERDVAALAPGQPALVLPESDSEGRGLRGRIREISPVVDRSTGTVKVTVDLPGSEAAPRGARPGSFARVRVETGRREDAVLVPKRAVLHGGGETYLFEVNDGKAERRDVTVGAEMTTPEGVFVEIADGLRAGTSIVVAGHAALSPGAAVEIQGS